MRFTFTDNSDLFTTTGDKWEISQAIKDSFDAGIDADVDRAVEAATSALENNSQVPDESTQAMLNISVTTA